MEGDSHMSSITYENVLSKEYSWTDDETVWLLGKKFVLPKDRNVFLDAVRSKFWFTYRRGFDSIGGTGPTSDAGWGCMLRCGQMMISQALLKLRMKHGWKYRADELQNPEYYKILKQFADDRSSCYSIQQIAQMGVQEGKNVGEWFGPNTVAQVLKKLSTFDAENNIAVYVAMDNTICTDDVEKLCIENKNKSNEIGTSVDHAIDSSSNEKGEWIRPLLVFVPLRLGLSEINPVYFKNIKQCLEWKESIGIIGGKPNHAYYFIGYTDSDFMVFLDPHTTQPSVTWTDQGIEIAEDSSYHCDSPSTMPISHLDPSLSLGFLCKTKMEFDALCNRVRSQETTKDSMPLFGIVKSFPTCTVLESRVVSVSVHNRHKKRLGDEIDDENACLTLDSDEDLDDVDEEFEILDVL